MTAAVAAAAAVAAGRGCWNDVMTPATRAVVKEVIPWREGTDLKGTNVIGNSRMPLAQMTEDGRLGGGWGRDRRMAECGKCKGLGGNNGSVREVDGVVLTQLQIC